MTTVEIMRPEVDDIRNDGRARLERAKAYAVTDQESMDTAGEMLKDIKRARAVIKERLGPSIEQAHKLHGTLCTLRNDLDRPFEQAERALKQAVGDYVAAERKREDDERRRLEEIRRKQAEDDQLRRAEALEAQGRQAEAEAVLDTPVQVVATPAVEPPKTRGVATTERWSARVDSQLALVRHIAEHPEYLNLVQPNMTALNELARAQKENFRFPGCVAVKETSVSVRG